MKNDRKDFLRIPPDILPAPNAVAQVTMMLPDKGNPSAYNMTFWGIYTKYNGEYISRYSEYPWGVGEKIEDNNVFEIKIEESTNGRDVKVYWVPSVFIDNPYNEEDSEYHEYEKIKKEEVMSSRRILVTSLSGDKSVGDTFSPDLKLNLFMVAATLARGDYSLIEEIASRMLPQNRLGNIIPDGIAQVLALSIEEKHISI